MPGIGNAAEVYGVQEYYLAVHLNDGVFEQIRIGVKACIGSNVAMWLNCKWAIFAKSIIS